MLKGIKGGPSYGIMVCGHGSRNQNAVGGRRGVGPE